MRGISDPIISYQIRLKRSYPVKDDDGSNQPLTRRRRRRRRRSRSRSRSRRRRRPVVLQSRVSFPLLPADRSSAEEAGLSPVPASKTGPGLPPVRPHRPLVMQLLFLRSTSVLLETPPSHIVWSGQTREKEQKVNKDLNFNAAKVGCSSFVTICHPGLNLANAAMTMCPFLSIQPKKLRLWRKVEGQ